MFEQGFQQRKSGILLHPSSLPSEYAIGDFGKQAYALIDKLRQSKQTLWQMLPLCPVDATDSPYQSAGAFAGEPLFISPDSLVEAGLLLEEEVAAARVPFSGKTNFQQARAIKYPLLQKAFARFRETKPPKAYDAFCKDNAHWLADYALFLSIKSHLIAQRKQEGAVDEEGFLRIKHKHYPPAQLRAFYDSACWNSFPKPLRTREEGALSHWRKQCKEEIAWHTFLQYLFHTQWKTLKTYANEAGISLIGDAPIFVSYDSVDVWANQGDFLLDAKGFAKVVAGVPPDYFSETGQLWGNPLYHWKAMKQNGYRWWMARIEKALSDVDILRIDHFRAFESYWEIPAGAQDARMGSWKSGPGIGFFQALEKKLGKLPIIAEDLGIITDEVRALREKTGFPGMCILQFAFGEDKNGAYLPHNQSRNAVVYSGTHDNNTTIGWYDSATEAERDHYRRYMNASGDTPAWDFIRLAFQSPAVLAILPIQDLFALDAQHRMNAPGTIGQNWSFACDLSLWSEELSASLRYLSELFARN